MGEPATFFVTVTGSKPIGFHWLYNGNAGRRYEPDLGFDKCAKVVCGGYSVILTNETGSITSKVATLNIDRFNKMTTGSIVAKVFLGAGRL